MRNKQGLSLKTFFKNDLFKFLVIFFGSFFIRMTFLPKLVSDPAFALPILDCKEFNFWAFNILKFNHWQWIEVNNHTPLYAYFLAVIYKIFGYKIFTVTVFQYLIGSLCAVLVFDMVKRLINEFAAWFSALLMSCYWFFIYIQSYLYSETLSLFLNLLLLRVLLFSKDSIKKYVLAGILFGLSVICRPDILLFLFFIFLWMLVEIKEKKRIFKYYALFLASFLLIFLPVLIRNYIISGEILLRKQVGLNFYVGNNIQYKGSNIYIEIGDLWARLITMPYREGGLDPSTASETQKNIFFIHKTFEFIRHNPRVWARFILAKTFMILTGQEFLRSEDIYFWERYIRGTPFKYLATRIIFVLAIPGIWFSFFYERKKYLLLYLFLLSEMFLVFFAFKTRYLLPAFPVFIFFSVYCVSLLREKFRAKAIVNAISIILIVSLFLAFSFINVLGIYRTTLSEVYFAIGNNFSWSMDHQAAIFNYEKALRISPKNISVIHYLAKEYTMTGQFDQARDVFRQGFLIAPYSKSLQTDYSWMKDSIGKKIPVDIREEVTPELQKRIEAYLAYFRYPRS